MRSGNLFSKRDTAVLDAPEQNRASGEGQFAAQSAARRAGGNRGASVTEMPLRRGANPNDFADGYDSDSDFDDGFDPDREFAGRGRRHGVRVSFHGGLVPRTLWGRIAMGGGLLILAGAAVAAGLAVRSYLLRDEHFIVPGSESIQIAGNNHLTRAQLLSVFGEDVERNVFNIPLAERRAQLESLPWVAHATVMRLLPNRVRVAIVERTPVAFVRQGTQIGLVDANGVLLDMAGPEVEEAKGGDGAATDARRNAHYSFPVLTGISDADPLSTRAARMKIYLGFVAALDATGAGISHRLSEVDLSNPEDVKALIPDSAPSSTSAKAPNAEVDGATDEADHSLNHSADRASDRNGDILVHFGDDKYLERFHRYEEHLAEWRMQYPRLASVDMRYEQQVVLEMQPGPAAKPGAASATAIAAAKGASGDSSSATRAKPAVAKAASARAGHAASAKARTLTLATASASAHPKAIAPVAASASPVVPGAAKSTPAAHFMTSFAVTPAGTASTPRQTPSVTKPTVKAPGPGVSAGGAHAAGMGTGQASAPAAGFEETPR